MKYLQIKITKNALTKHKNIPSHPPLLLVTTMAFHEKESVNSVVKALNDISNHTYNFMSQTLNNIVLAYP
jgi:hypothetical protein